MSDHRSAFSLGRLLILLAPILAIALAVNYSLIPGIKQAELQKLESDVISKLLGDTLTPPTVTVTYVDKDGDLDFVLNVHDVFWINCLQNSALTRSC